jgi:hypothetical protein
MLVSADSILFFRLMAIQFSLDSIFIAQFFKFNCYTSTKKEVKQTSFCKPPSILSNMHLVTRSKKESTKPMVACSFLGLRVALISFLGLSVRVILYVFYQKTPFFHIYCVHICSFMYIYVVFIITYCFVFSRISQGSLYSTLSTDSI